MRPRTFRPRYSFSLARWENRAYSFESTDTYAAIVLWHQNAGHMTSSIDRLRAIALRYVANDQSMRSIALRYVARVPILGPLLIHRWDQSFAHHFVPDLQDLHDVLARTEMDGHYWMWAGMLLGWAREGDLLAHDRDADFALLPCDVPLLLRAVPALRHAGFEPVMQFRNNEGQVTELVFRRHDTKFEFFVFEPVDGMLRYFVYGWPPDNLVEVESRVPDQDLTPFDFLGRTWLRHTDVELELTCMYGDWRTPRREWNYLQDDLAMVSVREWINPDSSWPIENS